MYGVQFTVYVAILNKTIRVYFLLLNIKSLSVNSIPNFRLHSLLFLLLLLPSFPPAGARKQWDGARSRGQVDVHWVKESTVTHTE